MANGLIHNGTAMIPAFLALLVDAAGALTIVVAGISDFIIADRRIMTGAILLFGCVGVLFMNVLWAARN
jgi:hypothetical protein